MRESDNSLFSSYGAFQEVYKASKPAAESYNPLSGMSATPAPATTPLSGVGQYKTVDPEFTAVSYKNLDASTKEVIAANAASNNMTPQQYYESRGGVNKAGYYGDSWSAQSNLTDAEYQKVINDAQAQGLTGVSIGQAINAATDKKRAENGLPPLVTTGGGGGTNTGGGAGAGAGSSPVTGATTDAANKAVLDQIALLTQQIADMQAAAAAEAAKPKVVGQKTVRKTGGVVEVYETMSDGTQGALLSSYTDFGARDSVMKMFENTGLGQAYITSLMDTVDQVYRDNIAPTEAQVLNSIYNSEAYKTRFAANEAIKKRMADGKGRPGDRLLTPYEYIQTEKAYEEILREAGLPTGFYDQQEDFTNFIAMGVSVAELTDRVNIAKNALNNADEGIKTALKDYYGLTNEDLTAYLLDKDRAMNLIDSRFKYTTEEAKKMYTSAEIGGAALRAGQMSDKAFAEEIYKAGKAGQAEAAFQTAATQQRDYRRLMGLYGETAGEQDIAREELALAGGTDVTVKKKKLASKERAMFQQKSAIDTTSLGRRSKTADV